MKGRRAFIGSTIAAAAVAAVVAPPVEAAMQGFCPIDGTELAPGFTVADVTARTHALGVCKMHGLIERDPSK